MDKRKVFEAIDDTEVLGEALEETVKANKSGLGKIVLISGAIVAGVTAVVIVTRKKREERWIKKLTKSGYLVVKQENNDDETADETDESEELE